MPQPILSASTAAAKVQAECLDAILGTHRRSASGAKRAYDQGRTVRREIVGMPATYEEADRTIVEYGLSQEMPPDA